MTEFTSQIRTIPHNDARVFAVLSDLSNMQRVRQSLPQDSVKAFTLTDDRCSFEVSPIGKIEFHIVDREPNKTIKFETTQSPVPLLLWIQLKQVAENDTRMKMTVRAELNPFLKPMVSKPMQEAVDKIAEILAALPYEAQEPK
ncbi:polyketide cyclase [Tannerella sp. oral taxon 808]|nr:polyketide cyclase [Tannerella sp. oral taxon 808]PNE29621.1 polyketide cyclase [Tannerella sp. oral taxon 808]